MKSLLSLIGILGTVLSPSLVADTKISQLPLTSAAATNTGDSVPFVNSVANATQRFTLGDIANLPALQTQFSLLIPSQTGQSGNCLKSNGTTTFWTSCLTGSVTSVGLLDGSTTPIYTITNSPVTSTGTLTFSLATETKNTVLIGPTSGSAAQPTFRALTGADLPNPSPSTLGGVESIAAVTHNFLVSVSPSGVPAQAQPVCGDLSDSSASCATDTTNASNISSGTLPAGRLPSPTPSTLGGVESLAAVTHNFLTSISTAGVPTQAQPACGDLSNSAASCSTDTTNAANISSGILPSARMPSPTPSTLGGVESISAVTHEFLTSISTGGVPAQAQPACGDLSNATTSCSTANASTATASNLMTRDANANTQINNIIQNYATTATAASTTTLTVGSAYQQYFTGTTTQTVVLPDATTLVLGHTFLVVNLSTGIVTVNKNGGTTVQALAASSFAYFTVTNIGSAAGSWNPSYTVNDAGGGTVTSVTFTGDGTVLSSTPSSAVTVSGTVTASLNTQAKNTFLSGPTTGSNAAPTFRVLNSNDIATGIFTGPTVQKFASGSGTYTTPTSPRSPLYIRIRMVGGGGGGGSTGSSGSPTSGGAGGNTTFGSSLLTANGGSGGATANGGVSGGGGAGGTASANSPALGSVWTGGHGQDGGSSTVSGGTGGPGAGTPFGGTGSGSLEGTAGVAGAGNSGAGGGGGGGLANVWGGGGGGAGGFVDAIIVTPSATYSYAVGAGGTAGGVGGGNGFAGGTGGNGYIEVWEYYQ